MFVIFENVDANIPLIKRYDDIVEEWIKWLEKGMGKITCKCRYPSDLKWCKKYNKSGDFKGAVMYGKVP